MKPIAFAAALMLAAAPALANHCPTDMAKIDEALASGTELSEAELTESDRTQIYTC